MLMLLHDDDFACEITVSAGCALFDSEKLTTLMQNIAREHVFEEDMFAKWSNSLFPLEKLDEAAESGRSYRVRIDRAAGKLEEEVGGDVPEGEAVLSGKNAMAADSMERADKRSVYRLI